MPAPTFRETLGLITAMQQMGGESRYSALPLGILALTGTNFANEAACAMIWYRGPCDSRHDCEWFVDRTAVSVMEGTKVIVKEWCQDRRLAAAAAAAATAAAGDSAAGSAEACDPMSSGAGCPAAAPPPSPPPRPPPPPPEKLSDTGLSPSYGGGSTAYGGNADAPGAAGSIRVPGQSELVYNVGDAEAARGLSRGHADDGVDDFSLPTRWSAANDTHRRHREPRDPDGEVEPINRIDGWGVPPAVIFGPPRRRARGGLTPPPDTPQAPINGPKSGGEMSGLTGPIKHYYPSDFESFWLAKSDHTPRTLTPAWLRRAVYPVQRGGAQAATGAAAAATQALPTQTEESRLQGAAAAQAAAGAAESAMPGRRWPEGQVTKGQSKEQLVVGPADTVG